jgi:hypothetical protein
MGNCVFSNIFKLMKDNANQKLSFATSLNRVAERIVGEKISSLGLSLPCHVIEVQQCLVKVAFDVDAKIPQVTIPVIGITETFRPSVKVGTKGLTIPASVYVAGIAGISTTIPSLELPANLSCLAFLPIGNKQWEDVNTNYHTIKDRISDTVRSTTPTQMYERFNALTELYNTHTHSGGSPPDQQFTGESIAS